MCPYAGQEGTMGVKLHLFLTSTVIGVEESASHTGRQGRLHKITNRSLWSNTIVFNIYSYRLILGLRIGPILL